MDRAATVPAASPSDGVALLDSACAVARAMLGAPSCFAVLDGAGGLRLAGLSGLDEDRARAFLARAAFRDGLGRGAEPLVLRDLPEGAGFCACIPLHTVEGGWAGALCVIDAAGRADPDAVEWTRLAEVARLAAGALRAQEAERRLACSESRHAQAQAARRIAEQTASCGHWRLDVAARTLAWSAGIAAIFGRNAILESVPLETHCSYYHPDDRGELERRIHHALDGRGRLPRGGYEHRLRIVRPDGEIRHVSVRGIDERDPAGRLVAIHGICLDVTDFTRLERAAEETGALLRATLEAIDQGIVITDAQQRVRAVNRRAADLLGLAEDALRVGEVFAPSAEADARIRTCPAEGGGTVHVVTPILGPDLEDRVGTRPRDLVHPEDMPPARAGASSGLARPVPEPAALDAIAAAVGRERVHELLVALATELEARFGRRVLRQPREVVAQEAHAMIAAAAMLGFTDLARLCREVEAACRDGLDYDPALTDLRRHSAAVVAGIGIMRAA